MADETKPVGEQVGNVMRALADSEQRIGQAVADTVKRVQVSLIHLNREEPPAQHALYQEDDPDGDYYDGPRLRPGKAGE